MRRRHHVLIRIRRWKEGRPLADSHKAWLMQAGFAASLPYRRLKQRAQGTAATASVPAVPATRRRNHWNRRSRPRTLVARSAVGALELLAPQAEIPGILGYIP